MKRFTATPQPVPHGGHFVAVPAGVAAKAGLAHGLRVRGTVDGVPYRSSLMKYSGVFHLGLHQATLAKAGWELGAEVSVSIEPDLEPLPTDVVPADLREALDAAPRSRACWDRLAPATRRDHVKQVLEAKKPETRARRIARIVELLKDGVPPRRTWKPVTARR